ncbi:MAG: HAD-IIIC family phosphatase [Pseudomonadota bacterium]
MSDPIEQTITPADVMQMSTAQIDRRYRALNDDAGAAELRVAFLGNHTLDPLQRATTVMIDALGVPVRSIVGAFDQHFQELLDEQSQTRQFEPNAIVLSLSLRYLAPKLVYGNGVVDPQTIGEEIDRVVDIVSQWAALALANSSAALYVCNFTRPPAIRFGPADTALASGEQFIYATLNHRLSAITATEPRLNVIDTHHAAASAGIAGGWNPRMYHLAKIEWDSGATLHMAKLIGRACRAQVRPARKCLVLDMDNTLWGGVLGEEGPQGIKIGNGDPTGEAFSAFQSAALDMKARGVVLAACSKNNLADVEEAFRVRDDMPLKLDDFAYRAINWEPKNKNIVAIAQALNIGTDSLVFIDDNPVECELIRQTLPEVLTLQLPSDPSILADFLYDLPDFDKLRLTAEDARKTEQYAENFKREELQKSVGDLDTFLESLDTRVEIAQAATSDVARVTQLFTKTNQFNVTTIRYSTTDVESFIAAEDTALYTIRAADKFGDLGLIGVCLLRLKNGAAAIDSFVMSCRALGRGIETAATNLVKAQAFTERGVTKMTARYLPTKKNKPAVDFFERQGFTVANRTEAGEVDYVLSASDSNKLPTPGITVLFEGQDHE